MFDNIIMSLAGFQGYYKDDFVIGIHCIVALTIRSTSHNQPPVISSQSYILVKWVVPL